MKKKLLLLNIFLLINFFTVWSQNSFKANYIFESYGDYQIKSYLYFDHNKAWYSKHQSPRSSVSEEGYEFYHYKNNLDWYYNLDTDSILMFRDFHGYPLLSANWKSDITWEITEEFKTIAGFKAQKAIGQPYYKGNEIFKYEKVIAWFTMEIPVRVGPEGYHGLPGLIIQTEYSGMGIYKCTLSEIKFNKKEEWSIPDASQSVNVPKVNIFNPQYIDKKWLKKQKKLLDTGE